MTAHAGSSSTGRPYTTGHAGERVVDHRARQRGHVGAREEWLAARKDLLAKEKELTRQRDALSAERLNLPMVEIEKDYTFDSPNGTVCLTGSLESTPEVLRRPWA